MRIWDPNRVFTALVRPHLRAMHRVAWRWTRDSDAAEDLVQDVLIKLVDRIDEMRAVENLRPWLVKVLYRRFVDVHRQEARSPVEAMDAVPDVAAPNDPIETHEWQQLLAAALERLESGHRDILLLHDVEGYTGEETAEILGIPLGTVKSRVHRARESLKKILDPGTF